MDGFIQVDGVDEFCSLYGTSGKIEEKSKFYRTQIRMIHWIKKVFKNDKIIFWRKNYEKEREQIIEISNNDWAEFYECTAEFFNESGNYVFSFR